MNKQLWKHHWSTFSSSAISSSVGSLMKGSMRSSMAPQIAPRSKKRYGTLSRTSSSTKYLKIEIQIEIKVCLYTERGVWSFARFWSGGFGEFPQLVGPTIATYCPNRPGELPKFLFLNPSEWPDAPLCTSKHLSSWPSTSTAAMLFGFTNKVWSGIQSVAPKPLPAITMLPTAPRFPGNHWWGIASS